MQFFKDLAAHVTGIEVDGSYKDARVEVRARRDDLGGNPVIRAYDKDNNFHIVEDSGRNHPGEKEWTEKVDRNWWGGVKMTGCGDE